MCVLRSRLRKRVERVDKLWLLCRYGARTVTCPVSHRLGGLTPVTGLRKQCFFLAACRGYAPP